MQLLAPWFLLATLAVAVPIWVHLIRREQSLRLPFSSLMFLRRVPIKSVYRRHLKHLPLLAARALLIVLIALAFARPYFPAATSAILTPSANRRTIILLDTSLSMQQGNRWQRAIEEARRVISSLGEGQDAQIVAFASDFQIQNLPTADKAALRTALEGLAPTALTTSYEHAFRAVERIAEDSDRPLSVVLISDMQKSGLGVASQSLALRPVAEFRTVDVAEADVPNWTVEDVRVRPQVFRQRYPERVQARVHGFGTEEASKEIVFSLGGRVLQRKSVRVPASGVATVEFDPFDVPLGINRGEVRILPEDALPLDDSFQFTLERAEPYRLLFLREAGEDAELYYVRNALGAQGDSPWVLEARSPQQTPSLPMNNYALVMLSNVAQVPAELGAQLRALVERGGGLLITMGNRFPAPALEQQFQELWPAPAAERRVLTRDSERLVLLGDFERGHPIFRDLEEAGAQSLRSVETYAYVRLQSGGTVLLRFANGDPALVEKQVGRGRVLLFASMLDNVSSDFPLHPIFIPLLHEMARYAGRIPDEAPAYRIPTTIALASYLGARPGGLASAVWDVTAPDGRREVPLEQSRRLDFLTLRQPGFYEIREPNRSYLVAANPDPKESDLRQLSEEDRALWIAGAQALQQSAAFSTPSESEKRQASWWTVLLLAVIVAVVEVLLANPFLGPRRVMAPSEGLRENHHVGA